MSPTVRVCIAGLAGVEKKNASQIFFDKGLRAAQQKQLCCAAK
jgi:hypothetical protein